MDPADSPKRFTPVPQQRKAPDGSPMRAAAPTTTAKQCALRPVLGTELITPARADVNDGGGDDVGTRKSPAAAEALRI